MLTEDISGANAPPVSPDEIRAELARILEGPSFHSSERCREFLRYVVEQTLTGSHPGIKERTIGVALFGRSPTYDTSADGIVRINASEVRKRLALYYADAGKGSAVLVTLPLGSYLPSISRAVRPLNGYVPVKDPPRAAGANFNPEEAERDPQLLAKPSQMKKISIASLLLVAMVGLFVEVVHLNVARSISNRFWQPLVSDSEPILIVTAFTPVYLPPSRSSSPNDPYRLLTDRYVGGGDLVAAVQLSSMLASVHHPYNLKMNTSITLDDLRDKPTILIGYASTQWADITKNFRFFIQRGMVTDRGQDTEWRPHHQEQDHHIGDDYAIISRAFDPETHSMIVLISGCTGYGTEEAARMVTDPKLLDAALRDAPKDWQQKNLQLVLHVEVIANSPANAKVISSYYW